MQCPKCKDNSLKAIKASKTNIELERCPNCKGLCFDKDELTSILGKRAAQDFEIPKYAASNSKDKCHKCNEGLHKFCYPNTMTMIDACKGCSGIWLDNLEWKEILEARHPDNQMTCPKCSAEQKKSDSCHYCGIIIDKFLAIKKTASTSQKNVEHVESTTAADPESSFNQANYRKALKSSMCLNSSNLYSRN
ncbi:MAG: Zn-finger nucleic acid-binding protein [Gammaproteobacteria bacterium]|jgi:Zn-finger nucleic acid-binding protein